MRFLTDFQEIQQYDTNMYFTKHNQIFEDSEGVLHLTPRFLRTDGYTILDIFAPIAGGRFEEDIRCCCGHDLWCRYKQDIIITISEAEMLNKGYLVEKVKSYPDGIQKSILVAENLPKNCLKVIPIDFVKTNKLFAEMLKSCKVNKVKRKILSAGVYFNIGWFLRKGEQKEIDLNSVYTSFL